MPSCSCIVPVLNEQAQIGDLLHLLRQKFPEAELVLVDGGSSDETVALATPLCDQLLHSPVGRATQMNLGASVAGGDYLFFLHADTSPEFDDAVLQTLLLDRPSWGFCQVRLSGGARALRVVESSMNWRSRLSSVATGDQMLWLRRDLFEQLGGYAAIPLMEDVDLCKRLRCHAKPVVIHKGVCTSSRRWESSGIALTVIRMWALRLAYSCGVAPKTLWRFYYGQQ